MREIPGKQVNDKRRNNMVKIRPFAAVRPPKQYVEEVAARPYDVLNSEEAKAEAGKVITAYHKTGNRF